MMTAARTAPKGKGVDIIEIGMVCGDELKTLSDKMVKMSEVSGLKFLLRDSANILESECVILVGTRILLHALNCGHCGFDTCAEKPASAPCVINSVDVGIAVGSACATAADLRVDTRVMFSAGWAAEKLGWLGEGVGQTMAIAVSASSKSPFFDRIVKK